MGKIIYTSGSWDLFHVGHLNVLEKSKTLGDRLVVGVSTDELIEDYKGVKPVIPFEQRLRIVKSLSCVDLVIEQRILTDVSQLQEHKIDIVTIGDDWKNRYLEGLEWMKKHGEVVYLPYTKGVSTTGIKREIIENAYTFIRAGLSRENESMESWKRCQEEKG